MKIESVSRLEVTKSFAKYLPLVIFAGLFYTLIISGGILFLANEKLGMTLVFRDIAVAVTLLVTGLMVLYCHWVVSLISSCYMELGSTDLKIKASYPGGSKEQQYLYANIEKIVFGQNLSWTESSLEKMSKYGIIVNSGMRVTKDIKAGKLVVNTTDKSGKTFNFIDKAFNTEELSEFLLALKEKGVAVELS